MIPCPCGGTMRHVGKEDGADVFQCVECLASITIVVPLHNDGKDQP